MSHSSPSSHVSSSRRSLRAHRALPLAITAAAASMLGACAAPVGGAEGTASAIAEPLTSAPAVTHAARIKQIAVGGAVSYALAGDGAVYAWGSNNFGALGNGDMYTPAVAPTPVRVPVGPATRITAGASGACALMADTTISCWGLESEDGFGPGFTATPQTMQIITGTTTAPLTDAVGLVEGEAHGCAWKKDGTVWCWGNDDMGETGDPSLATTAYAALQVPGIADAVDIVASRATTCVLRRSGDVACFGSNDDGELGNGAIGDGSANATPAIVPLGVRAHALYGGGQGTFCATTWKGAMCWGWNRWGVGGTGIDTPALTSPTVIDAPMHARFAFGGGVACRWNEREAGACWGFGASGQLVNDGSNSPVPVALTAPRHIEQIAVGDRHTCLLSHGEVTCWGINDQGQLGNGATASKVTPPAKVQF